MTLNTSKPFTAVKTFYIAFNSLLFKGAPPPPPHAPALDQQPGGGGGIKTEPAEEQKVDKAW